MGFKRSSAELTAKADRALEKADRAFSRGRVVKSIELGVKAIRYDDKAERRANRR